MRNTKASRMNATIMVITTWRVNGHNISEVHSHHHKHQCKRSENNFTTNPQITVVRLHSPHHGNYIESHEIQPAPVTCHRSNPFLSGNKHNSKLPAPSTAQIYLQNCVQSTERQCFDLTMVMYQLLTTVSSNRVTAEDVFERVTPTEIRNELVDWR